MYDIIGAGNYFYFDDKDGDRYVFEFNQQPVADCDYNMTNFKFVQMIDRFINKKPSLKYFTEITTYGPDEFNTNTRKFDIKVLKTYEKIILDYLKDKHEDTLFYFRCTKKRSRLNIRWGKMAGYNTILRLGFNYYFYYLKK